MRTFILVIGQLWLVATSALGQTIKLGSLAPEGSPYHKALLEIAQSWKTISGGKVVLRIYPGGIVGDESDMIRKMRIGQLNAAALTSVSLITVTPDIEAFSFPSVIRSDEELAFALDRVGPAIEKQLEAKGFTLLAWTTAGWVHFFSREPVITPADLQRQKLFFWGSDTAYVELLKRTGFQPVSLPVAELLPSLQSGLIEAFGAPPTVALAFQWYTKAPHMAAMRWQPLPGCVVVDNRTWNKIPEAMRGALMASARAISLSIMKEAVTLEANAIAVMKKNGLIVHEVPETIQADWITLVEREGYPLFVGPRFSRAIFDDIREALRARHDEPADSGSSPAGAGE